MHRKGIIALAPSVAALVLIGLTFPQVSTASTRASGATDVTGTVRTEVGSPAEASVRLYAYPDQAVEKGLHAHQVVPMRLISEATTTASGQFALSAGQITALPRTYIQPDGTVNAKIVSLDPPAGRMGVYSLPLRASSGGKLHSSGPVAVHMMIVSKPVRQAFVPLDDPVFCQTTNEGYMGSPRTIVGASYNLYNQDHAAFTYEQGASSTLGISVSASGEYGTWNAGGTKGTSSTAEQDFHWVGGAVSKHYETYFSMDKYKVYCWDILRHWSTTQYDAESVAWDGGGVTISTSPIAPYSSNCYPEGYGNRFVTEHETAYNWSTGFETGSILGIGASARTGYSTEARLTYSFWHSDAHVCGTNGPPASAALVVAD